MSERQVCHFSSEVPEDATTHEDMWVRNLRTCDNPNHNKPDLQPRTFHQWIENGERKGLWHWGSDKEIADSMGLRR